MINHSTQARISITFIVNVHRLYFMLFIQAYYYFAIAEDLLLRFMWTITVTIGEEEIINSEVLKTFVASLEVFR